MSPRTISIPLNNEAAALTTVGHSDASAYVYAYDNVFHALRVAGVIR
jgi:hypothetical protein